MKNFIIKLIRGYQNIPGNWHNSCKYQPSCSNYMIGAIKEFGVIKGIFLGIVRIIKCNPFSKGGYDPVPIKKERKNNGYD